MLKHRILTAIPLAVAVIWMLFQPTDVFVYMLYVIAIVAGFEWSGLTGCRASFPKVVYAAIVCLIAYLFVELLPDFNLYLIYAPGSFRRRCG